MANQTTPAIQIKDSNVGIGTVSPSTKLDVNGVITATGGTSTQWNTAYGWGNHASQGYATQTYVNTAIANLVDSAPATLDTLNELAAALGDDPNFATTVATSIGTKQNQLNGTGFVKVSGTTVSYDNSTYYLASNPSGFISSYTETDTLATVTGRGASTSTNSVFTGGLQARKNQTDNNYSTAALWTESYGNTTTGIAFHISGNVGKFLEMRTNGILYWDNAQVWTAGTLTNLNQLTNGPGYITGYTETDTLASVTARGNTTASTVNFSTLNASDTNARYYYQSTNGVPSNNLGTPTITEMALFDEQFNNKTAFYDPASLTFWTSSDGTNYTEYTGFNTTIKKRFLGGDSDSGVYIPNLTNRFRIELENSAGYVFLNQLYIYWSSNSHSTKVHIWVRRCDNNQWYQWTDSNVQVSSWPGHLYLPFGGIPFYPGYLNSTGHYNRIRIEFIPSWAGGTYSYTDINLNRMQIWGGYPAGKRNIYSTDENQNVSFPAEVGSTSFYATNFRASNAYYLNGTSYYLNSNNGGVYTNARFETASNLFVGGNSYLGNASGDETHINDILRVGATDSGDAHFYFGEGSLAGSDYGSHWFWDSGYTFTWNTRNNGTDTALFDYVTNDTTYLNWRRNFHMQNREINYTAQLHFNGGTRFVTYNSNYLYFQPDSTSVGGIIVRDGNSSVRGYSAYFDGSGFGLLNSSGNWGIRLNPGNVGTELYHAGNLRLDTRSGGIGVQGNVYTNADYGYGLVGLYSAERYQGVFAMGDSYKLSADGTSPGSLYGIAWTHTNIGGQSKSGLGHQALFMANGSTQTAIGYGIWTVGLITTTDYGTSANWKSAYDWGNHASAGYAAASSLANYLPLAGGTMSGTLNFQQPVGLGFANGQYIKDNSAGGLIIYSGAAVNINGTSITVSNNTTVAGWLGVTGIVSANARKLSLGILDLNSGVTPAQFKIKTTIPWNYGGSDFTVNIKGFRYGTGQMVSLSIGWHYYNNEFYNRNAISNGAWAPTISLAKSPDGYVIIHIPSPDYWPKLYVESVYSSNSTDSYTSGWSWSDADLSDCTLTQTVPYKDLATNISGNAATATNVAYSGLTGTVPTWNQNTTGNAATSSTFSTSWTNYKGVTDNAVAGQLMWKNYGNNHTIFDASNSTSPTGSAVNNTNSAIAWTGTYPTLMGWNGVQTYGVRVDSARLADTAGALTSMNISQFSNNSGYLTSVPAQSQLISPNGATVVAADSAMPNAGHSFIHTLANGPGGNDGHILGMSWAGTTSVYGAQIFLDTDPNDIMAIRSRSSTGVWTSWKTVIHSGTIGSQSVSYATTAGALTSMDISQFTNNSGYIAAGSTVSETAVWTGATKFRSAGDISQTGAGNHALQILSDDGNDAFMAFHISSDYAVYFGLENSTNRLYTGGWSDGANKYQIWDSRDFSSTNISNWNTAYGWGNHASAGYQAASTAITTSNIGSQSVSNATTVGGITPIQFFNNMGDSHATRTSFDASTPSYNFGFRFIQGNTNGPALGGGGQFYSWYLGLGNDYPATGAGSYGMHVAIPRSAVTPYMSVRYNENNSLGSWIKIAAGYADTAGALTSMNISQFTNNSGYITGSYVVANGTSAGNIDADWGQSFKTFDPVPSGTPPLASPNIRTINVGDDYNRRTQLAFDYASDVAYFRRRDSSGWQTWREFIHSGNIGTQSVNYATTAGSAPNAGNINPFYNVTAGVGNGLRFWGGDDNYKISMGVGGLYQYGPVTDYSIKTQMDVGSPGRGFTWGNNGVTPVAALNATSGNMQIAGTFTASNFSGSSSGTNTGDQTNISGNAATASAVAWDNITSKPSWMINASLIGSHSNADSQVNSGFYENGGGGSNWPAGSATWYNSINVRHSNQGNYHGFQVAMSYYDNLLWFRSYQGSGTFQSWVYAISSANIGSQSVLYAATAGALTSMNISQFTNNSGYTTGTGSANRIAYWSSASNLTFDSNLYWDNTNSRLGIGTTSPGAKVLLVEGNFVTRFLVGQSTFTGYNSGLTAGQKGNIIVGQANSTNNAYVINFIYQSSGSTSNTIGLGFYNNDDIVVITAGKSVGIATTSPNTSYTTTIASVAGKTGVLLAQGNVKIESGALGVGVNASATVGRIDASNDIVAYSSSDERLKENIIPIQNALDKVKSLTGVEFDWKPEHKDAHGYEGHDTGIIAQQVQQVMPTAVRTNETGFLAVRYEKLIGLLIEGMKEQQAQINELKAKLDGLTE